MPTADLPARNNFNVVPLQAIGQPRRGRPTAGRDGFQERPRFIALGYSWFSEWSFAPPVYPRPQLATFPRYCNPFNVFARFQYPIQSATCPSDQDCASQQMELLALWRWLCAFLSRHRGSEPRQEVSSKASTATTCHRVHDEPAGGCL